MTEPVVPPVDVIAEALSFLGPWGALTAVALKWGVPFVGHLLQNAANKVDPTPGEWKLLADKIEIPGETLIPLRPALGV